MNKTVWQDLHDNYKTRDWSHKPSLFAETAVTHFPTGGMVLELGAGLGQDSLFFAENGYDVTSTDIESDELSGQFAVMPDKIQERVSVRRVDLREELPFADGEFNVVYAHLSGVHNLVRFVGRKPAV